MTASTPIWSTGPSGSSTGLPGVVTVPELRVRWLGHRLTVDGTVQTAPTLTMEEFHRLEHEADRQIRASLPSVGAVRLHATVHPEAHAAG